MATLMTFVILLLKPPWTKKTSPLNHPPNTKNTLTMTSSRSCSLTLSSKRWNTPLKNRRSTTNDMHSWRTSQWGTNNCWRLKHCIRGRWQECRITRLAIRGKWMSSTNSTMSLNNNSITPNRNCKQESNSQNKPQHNIANRCKRLDSNVRLKQTNSTSR